LFKNYFKKKQGLQTNLKQDDFQWENSSTMQHNLYSVLKDAAVHYDRLDQGNLILSETIIKFK